MAWSWRLTGMASNPGDERGVFGVAQRRVVKQGADRGQPQVAGPDAVAPVGFKKLQECGERINVKVGELEGIGGGPCGFVQILQQQPERVAVCRNGVGAGGALVNQVGREETLKRCRENAHGVCPSIRSCTLSLTICSSSGLADRYQ